MIEAVILDVGGVLLVPAAEILSEALEIELTPEAAERAHYVGVAALDAATGVAEERHAYRAAYAQAIGVAADVFEDVLERMAELWNGPTIDLWAQPVRGSAEGIRALAERGLKLAIVSNSDGTVEEQLKRGQICQVGEGLGVPVLAIVDSHVVQVAKPAAEIFRHALDPLGVDPSDALYVGDTVRYDVNGARAAGLRPVHQDPLGLCTVDDHAHVRTLTDVIKLL